MRALTDDELKSCDCFHCGEPVPPGTDFAVEINGIRQSMCCPGCQAVAELISGSGLARFYEQRTAYNDRPEEDALSGIEQFAIYDTPELLAEFSAIDSDDKRQAALLLGGVSCAACTWLIEQTLARVEGIERAVVNLQ
ncbi:MAG: heavy metal translocating P-type ATPase metal-binding domain-containing protein, partial [Halioglobus sp.]